MSTFVRFSLILSSAVILFVSPGKAQTTLTSGDISLLSLYADTSDAFSFVTWLNLADSTVIRFTDNGWTGTGLRTTEGTVIWSNDTGSAIAAGTVIVVTNVDVAPRFTDLGTVTTAGSPSVVDTGDQLIAYQNTGTTTNFLFALDTTAGWEPAVGADSSAIPTGLTDFSTALLLGTNTWGNNASIDNSRYIGPRTGLTVAQYKTAIADPTNWEFDLIRFSGSPSSIDFVIVPEPSSILLVGVGLLGAVLLRRRRS